MKKYLLILIPLILTLVSTAQGDMAAGNNNDMMRSNHKIYVVVAVLTIILSAMFIFLFSIERRLKKLEENPTPNR